MLDVVLVEGGKCTHSLNRAVPKMTSLSETLVRFPTRQVTDMSLYVSILIGYVTLGIRLAFARLAQCFSAVVSQCIVSSDENGRQPSDGLRESNP